MQLKRPKAFANAVRNTFYDNEEADRACSIYFFASQKYKLLKKKIKLDLAKVFPSIVFAPASNLFKS